jgi:pimeloyl-ACP methyl ester carboxylesterase
MANPSDIRHAARRLAWAGAGIAFALSPAACSSEKDGGKETQTTTQRIAGPAGSLHVEDGGKGGLAVVFVHSFAGSTDQWSAQLAHLRPNRRAVALDLRGHGQSDRPAGNNYAIDSVAEDLAAVVDSLGLQRFVLVGHSMGNPTALAYTAKHPDRVAGLLLVAAPGKLPPAQAKKILAGLEADFQKSYEGFWSQLLSGATPATLARVKVGKQAMTPDAAMSIIRAVFEYDPLPALTGYAGPKLAVITPHDDQPHDLHNLVPNLPHKVVTGTSHWLQMDKPEEFNRILDEFLAGIERVPRTVR